MLQPCEMPVHGYSLGRLPSEGILLAWILFHGLRMQLALCLCRYPVYRYFWETDTLSIYLVKATKGLIDSSDEVTAGLLVDYTSSEEIVALDVAVASKKILAHFWHDANIYKGKAPLQLHTSFDAAQQLFTISFGDTCPELKTRATDDKRITVREDGDGHWASIVILAEGKTSVGLTASK